MASPGFLQQSTGQTSSSCGQTSSPSGTASAQHSLGMATLNQIKGETKPAQKYPRQTNSPPFTVLFFSQGRCLLWLEAQLCKGLCPDRPSKEQQGQEVKHRPNKAALLLLKLSLISDPNDPTRVPQPPVEPAPLLHTCTRAEEQRN